MRRLHLSNSNNRNAIIVGQPVNSKSSVILGKAGEPAQFKRYLSVGKNVSLEELTSELGEDLSKALIDGDPEIDMELVGQTIEYTTSMLTTSSGEPMYASPRYMEVTYAPDGSETGRKDPVDVVATVNDSVPLRWTGKKFPKKDVVRQFVFKRTIQLKHVDGVTFDFLHGIAKELDSEDAMVLLGAGESGKEPVVLQMNGTAYRGFLEGRINGDSYILLLHLSNMELKAPVSKEEKA